MATTETKTEFSGPTTQQTTAPTPDKIKTAKIIDNRLEIVFEDKDKKPINVEVLNGKDVVGEVWIFEELQCVYWNTIHDYRDTVGQRYAWNAYNPATNERATTGHHQHDTCYNAWLLQPEDDVKRCYAIRDYTLDWKKESLPAERKSYYVVMMTSEVGSSHFFTDWNMACTPFEARTS
jgi:hypothetical protein